MKCAAFDVFGTCLTRRVIAPTEVFRLVGRELARLTEQPHSEEFAEQFIAWRIEAERRARTREHKEDTRLANIWEELRRILSPLCAGIGDGPKLEMEAEKSVLGPILATKVRIDQERALDRRIIFISDMYLPAEFLRQCLQTHGLMHPGDGLYVSGDVGFTKRTGNLFLHVLAREQINRSDLSHFGDDPHSDSEVPRRLGIAAVLVRPAPSSKAENLLQLYRPYLPPIWLETAGRLHFSRLASPPAPGPDNGPWEGFVEDFLGPFLCIFGHWILQRSRADGVGRIFFAARDTRLLWAVTRQLAKSVTPGPDCRYLYISRQAVFLPSADDISSDSMPWLVRDFEVRSLPRLLAKLELSFDDWAPTWRRMYPDWGREDILTTVEHWDNFWKILRSPPFSDAIRRTIDIRRAAALSYFEQVGLLDSRPAGLVDLGWLLGCQKALNDICAKRPGLQPVRGYYLGLALGRPGPAETGPADALFYQNAGDLRRPNYLSWLGRNTLIEHILGLSDHPSVRAYGPDGSILFSGAATAIAIEDFQAIETALLRYTEKFGHAWAALAANTETAVAMLSTLLDDFFERPPPVCVTALRKIKLSEDQNNHDPRPLIQPFTWPEILHSLLPDRLGRHFPSHRAISREWPEASELATPPIRRLVYQCAPLTRRFYQRWERAWL